MSRLPPVSFTGTCGTCTCSFGVVRSHHFVRTRQGALMKVESSSRIPWQDSPINASRPVATQPRSVALIAVAIKRFALGVLTFEDPTHRYAPWYAQAYMIHVLCMKGFDFCVSLLWKFEDPATVPIDPPGGAQGLGIGLACRGSHPSLSLGLCVSCER